MQAQMESSKTKNSKGTRTTKVGGEQLKNKLKSGEINQGLNPYEKS